MVCEDVTTLGSQPSFVVAQQQPTLGLGLTSPFPPPAPFPRGNRHGHVLPTSFLASRTMWRASSREMKPWYMAARGFQEMI